MRPIRPGSIRTLQPLAFSSTCSDAELRPQQHGTVPLPTPAEPDPEPPGSSASAAGPREPPRPTGHWPRAAEPDRNRTSRIRKEAERLVQEQDEGSARARKQPRPLQTSGLHSSAPTPRRGKPGSSRSPKTSRAAASRKATPPPEQDDDAAESGVAASGELLASVQSLVAVLQQQMDAPREVRGHQDRSSTRPPPQVTAEVEALRVRLAQKEAELQTMKSEAEEELLSLRQHNYLLQSKLRSAEQAGEERRRLEAAAADPGADRKRQQMEKETKEQETLIRGYQQESEKLYQQMKAQQERSRAAEAAMFQENQRLQGQLAATREQLRRRTSGPAGGVGPEAGRVSDLQRAEETRRLEAELRLMREELELARARAASTSGGGGGELRVQEEEEEVAALRKRLQWFAENQELLDRDAGRLKAATAEILQLRDQVETLKQEVSRRSGEQQRKSRARPADTNRMQELQRQVKQLEQILRSRNPSSLPALIYAAASAEAPLSRVDALLERRIQRLEAELEGRDEEAKRALRAVEQHFQRVKLRYEQQICELERQLRRSAPSEDATESWRSRCQGLEAELQRVQDDRREEERRLQQQIQSLQQQLSRQAPPSPGRHQRQAEAASGARIQRLNQELAAKTRSVQELSRTVERLQRERRSAPATPHQGAAESRPQPGRPKPQRPPAAEPHPEPGPEGAAFPAAQNDKTYQPAVFTGSHISEVLQENQALRWRMEELQLQQAELQAGADEAKEELIRLRERCTEQLSSAEADHQRALDRLRAAHALEHSSSKMAELSRQLSSQEVAMSRLQRQLEELRGCEEALSVSRRREEALQQQLSRLLQELKDAKEAQSSEVKLLCSLERKVVTMETRQQQRVEHLQQAVAEAFQASAAALQPEAERWRRLAQDRSRDLDAFRSELDSILDVLRHLQRRGVVPAGPAPGAASTERRLISGQSF